MNIDQMSDEVARFFEEANNLQWKKNKDYHPDKIAFLEILRTACECGISVEQDLWGKIRKQYVAVRSYVIEGRTESEPPRSRMIDIAVYMGMFAFWDLYKLEVVHDALVFVTTQTQCDYQFSQCGPGAGEICDRCRFQFWLSEYANRLH